MIATLNFVVSPTANGPFSMGFSHVKVISHNEIEIPIQTNSSNTYVGIQENSTSVSSVLYPNPMTNSAHLFFSNASASTWTLTLTDLTGTKVCDQITTNGNTFTIERKNLSTGIYFYSINNSEGKYSNGKIVVE